MASYAIPAFGTSASTVHGYLLEALQEGESWLKTQRPATEWQRVLDALAPSSATTHLSNQSNTGYNKTKRITRELVASLGNFKYEGEYKVEYDQSLYQTAEHLTKRDRVWFRQARIHRAFRQLLQYGVAFGTAYAYQTWDKHFWGPYRGDIRLTALSPEDVTFVQLPRDHDLQQAYVVLICEELPINLARRRFYPENPAFAAALNPDRDSPGWIEKGLRKVQALIGGSPIFKYTGRDSNKDTASFPTVDIYHAYILDDSINTGPVARTIGDPETNWAYSVPVYGSDIPTGTRDETGAMITRRAREEDCRLFPLRRYCIFSRSVDFPCYDGPSPWWHGQAPLARFRFGDWAWEPLGSSLIGDVLTMQEGIEGIMQDVEDSSRARLDPPSVYDDTKVSKAWAESVNPRRAGVRVAADINFGEIFKVLGQPWQYEVPQWIPDWVKQQEARMDYLAAPPEPVPLPPGPVRRERDPPAGDEAVLPATDEDRLPHRLVDVRQDRADPGLRQGAAGRGRQAAHDRHREMGGAAAHRAGTGRGDGRRTRRPRRRDAPGPRPSPGQPARGPHPAEIWRHPVHGHHQLGA